MESDFDLSIDELRYDAIHSNPKSSKHIPSFRFRLAPTENVQKRFKESFKAKDPATSSREDLDERMLFSKRRKTYSRVQYIKSFLLGVNNIYLQ